MLLLTGEDEKRHKSNQIFRPKSSPNIYKYKTVAALLYFVSGIVVQVEHDAMQTF